MFQNAIYMRGKTQTFLINIKKLLHCTVVPVRAECKRTFY